MRERLDCCWYLFVFFCCVHRPLPQHCPVLSLRAYMCSYSQNRLDHSHWANLGKALSFVQTLAEGRRIQRLWNSCYRLSPPRFGLSWAIKWAMNYLCSESWGLTRHQIQGNRSDRCWNFWTLKVFSINWMWSVISKQKNQKAKGMSEPFQFQHHSIELLSAHWGIEMHWRSFSIVILYQ